MFNNTQLIALIVEEALLLLLLIGNGFTLLIGLHFLLSPSQAFRLNKRMSRWTSMRRSTKPLEQAYFLESTIYKYHRLFGLFAMFGAIFVLYRLGFNYNQESIVKILGRKVMQPLFAEWLLSAFLWFAVPIMLAILLIGAVLASRPSNLKGIEQYSNKWISTRKWILPLEKQQLSLDGLIHDYPRRFGLIVFTLSAYSALTLFITYIHYFC